MDDREDRIDVAVFDLGGVLLDWDPRHLYRKLFDDPVEMERFLREVCTPEWHVAHDRGASTVESCAELASSHPESADLIWAWAKRSEEMIAGEIPDSVDVLRDLKDSGLRCYALTNMEAETYPVRVERFAFLGWFDGTLVSGVEGIAKPDPAIYLRMLDRFGLDAPTTLVIDDNVENIDVAERVGFQTLLYRSPDQLRRELERMGLLSPRPCA